MTDDVFKFGPFHRRASPTQSFKDAKRQRKSGQVWGYPARGADRPEVKAFVGPLKPGMLGIEFFAPLPPGNYPPMGEVRWSVERSGTSPYLKVEEAAKLDVKLTGLRYNCRRITRSKQRP